MAREHCVAILSAISLLMLRDGEEAHVCVSNRCVSLVVAQPMRMLSPRVSNVIAVALMIIRGSLVLGPRIILK